MSTEAIVSPDKPQGITSTVLNMTPVVLTVLATIFAGVSSSEMTQSMFHRAMAAQEQSKSGDEWAFFQTKRIRGTNLETTGQLLDSFAHPVPFSAELFHTASAQMLAVSAKFNPDTTTKIKTAQKQFDDIVNGDNKQSFELLVSERLPSPSETQVGDQGVKNRIDDIIKQIAERKSESDTANEVRQLKPEDIQEATKIAEHNAELFEKACQPVEEKIDKIKQTLALLKEAVSPYRKLTYSKSQDEAPVVQLYNDLEDSLKLTAMHFDALRYKKEAAYNRRIAELFEVHVRRSGVESDRHRDRSRNFFYSMLVAQAGVTIASLALSKQRKSVLWMTAAIAGVIAIVFFSYIYFSL